MKYFSLLLLCITITLSSEAKIWRINNNAGVTADFTSFGEAAASASVAAGDTLHLEPSITEYATASFVLSKRIVVIGPGYFLDPANTTTPANTGLQVATTDSRVGFFRIGSGATGSKFIGISIAGSIYINGASNISFEKVYFPQGLYFEDGTNNNISFRKCFFNNSAALNSSGTAVITNFTCENSIFYNNAYVSIETFSGAGNLFRNNSIINSGNSFILNNTYIANNIFGTVSSGTFTNCTLKNNFFQAAQTLPGTATGNHINADMTSIYVNGSTGSLDARTMLKTGSPAIGAGLTIGSVVNPDCGAFGATDPYKLSGIPNVPSIYTLNVSTSVPSASTSMTISFSTKNNN